MSYLSLSVEVHYAATRAVTDRQTDGQTDRQTDTASTVTLAAHVRRELIILERYDMHMHTILCTEGWLSFSSNNCIYLISNIKWIIYLLCIFNEISFIHSLLLISRYLISHYLYFVFLLAAWMIYCCVFLLLTILVVVAYVGFEYYHPIAWMVVITPM